MSLIDANAAPSLPALRTVVDTLGSTLLTVVSAATGLDASITGAEFCEPDDVINCEAGTLVVLVGCRLDDPRLTIVVRAATTRRVAAVLGKPGPSAVPRSVTDAADDGGVALLSVPEETSWSRLHSLIRGALAHASPEGSFATDGVLGDLFALANATADAVGGPVTIEDLGGRVLAYSSLGHPIDELRRQTILGRRVPEDLLSRLRSDGVFQQLLSTDGVIRVQADDTVSARLVAPVRAGGETLGSIWVATDASPTKGLERSLVDAARVAASLFVRYRSIDLSRRVKNIIARGILDGRGDAKALWARLSMPPIGPFVVLGFELPPMDDVDAAVHLSRLGDGLSLAADAHRLSFAISLDTRSIKCIVCLANDDARKHVLQLAQRLVASASEAIGVPVHGALSDAVSDLESIPHAASQTSRALAILSETGFQPRVADFHDFRTAAILAELREVFLSRPQLQVGRVYDVVRHDREHGTGYIQTLHAYFDAFGDTASGAARVHVHPNTFRYRLRRIRELGLDLGNPDERLVAQLQLRFSDSAPVASGNPR